MTGRIRALSLSAAILLLVPACGPSLGDADFFTVTFSIDTTPVTLSELVLEVEYDDGEFDGSDSAVQCSPIGLDSATFDDEDDEDPPVLRATLRKSGNGMQQNNDLFACTFVSPITPDAGTFSFRIVSALNTAGQTVSAKDLDAIDFDIRQKKCASCSTGSTTSTTTSSTSSTSSTTTTTVSSVTTTSVSTSSTTQTTSTVIDTRSTTTTTTLPPGVGNFFDVVFEMTFPMAPTGALQFETDYSTAAGQFGGSGQQVLCKKPSGFGALVAFNDNDAGKVLSQGFVDSQGFSAPRVLATCRWDDNDGVAPAPGDFTLTTKDCSDLSSTAQNCFTAITSITACSCGDSTVNCVSETCDSGASSLTNTCGDGIVNCSACSSEACDDGNNTDDGNGCTADCQDNHVCGNGILESAFESCDDRGRCQAGSNPGTLCTMPGGAECNGGFCQTQSGDGCSATCTLEP